MTNNFYQILVFLMKQMWSFFNSWYLPGTNVTPAGFILAMAFLVLVIRFIRRLTFTNDTHSSDK